MIRTSVLLGLDDKFPVWHKSAGLAKNLSIAWWMFKYCGWKQDGQAYPDLAYVVETIEWPEGDKYFPCDMTKLFILENPLYIH